MPFNGSGTYSAPASTWNPAVSGSTIDPTAWNALLADISTALTSTLLKDGTQTATTSIPFAANITVGVAGATQGTVGFRGSTSGTLTLSGPAVAGSGTMTLQAGTDTLVGRATTDTLTNKTLTLAKATTTFGVGAATAAASGSGVTFPATQDPSTDPNTNDDYEEGEWTPIDGSGLGLSLTVTGPCQYVKNGQSVTVMGNAIWPVTASGASAAIGGLPFTSQNTTSPNNFCGSVGQSDYGSAFGIAVEGNGTRVFMGTFAGTFLTNANLSTKGLRFTATYRASA